MTVGEAAAGEAIREVERLAAENAGLRRDLAEAGLAAEEGRRLLMQDFTHRLKNTLAMVQAIATQTLRGARTIEEARDAVGDRVAALAGAHDVLLQANWTGAPLHRLLEGAAGPHGPGRFDLDGPDVRVGPSAALSLSLMFHELCTNAARHGALAAPEGRVAVTWSEEAGGGEERGGTHAVGRDGPRGAAGEGGGCLRLRWRETGGSPVAPPDRKGFGSRLIERGPAHAFGGVVGLDYRPDGLVVELEAPLAALRGTLAGHPA